MTIDHKTPETRSAPPQTPEVTKKKLGARTIALISGGAVIVAGAAAGIVTALMPREVQGVPAPLPSETFTSGPVTPGPETSAPRETVEPSTAPTEVEPSASSTPSASETQQVSEVLSNENVTELSPELIKVYENIADKVEAGDITYKQVRELTPAEQALVQQSLLYRLIDNGAASLDTSICYMKDPDTPECNANFASEEDSNEAIYGKSLGVVSAPVAYTDDSGVGFSNTLDPEASRILGDAAYANPHDESASNRIGKTYDTLQGRIDKGEKVNYDSIDVDVEDADGGGKAPRIIRAVLHKSTGDVETEATFRLKSYEVKGKTASRVLGLEGNQKFKIVRWEMDTERRIS